MTGLTRACTRVNNRLIFSRHKRHLRATRPVSPLLVLTYLRAYVPTCCRGSQDEGETTFNLQTPSVFIDIRVPKAGAALLGHHRGFYSMTVSFFFLSCALVAH